MASNSAIEWTESPWNPLTGYTKISPGCRHCYAERTALHLKARGQPNSANGFELALHENALESRLTWRKPHSRLSSISPSATWKWVEAMQSCFFTASRLPRTIGETSFSLLVSGSFPVSRDYCARRRFTTSSTFSAMVSSTAQAKGAG